MSVTLCVICQETRLIKAYRELMQELQQQYNLASSEIMTNS